MMVRAFARSREVAIRAALGASRGVVVAQMLVESIVLAAAGGVAGILLGLLGVQALVSSIPEGQLPRWISFGLDVRSLAFAVGATALAAVLFGLAPALNAAKGNLQQALHETARSSLSRRRRGFLSALVVGEIGLALLLLTSAGLLFQALRNVLKVDPGFRPENVLAFGVAMPGAKYPNDEQRILFVDRFLERLRALPGVKYAGAASSVPLGGHWGEFFVAEGQASLGPNDQNPVVLNIAAAPGYLDAIGVTFLSGRPFRERDGTGASRVAIINESFARRFFPDANPMGKRIRYAYPKDNKDWLEVIGVTRDIKHYGLDQEMRPSVFVPFRQKVIPFTNVVLRTATDPQTLVAPAREVLRQLDPDLPLYEPATMTERLDRSLWNRRFVAWVAAGFGITAALLAAAGIFGVISYAVSQRTREIGIRMAMGASPLLVVRQTLGHGLRLLALGVPIGIAATLGLASVLQRALFGLSARDPQTYTAAAIAVSAVVLASNIVPARRAARIDPIQALRAE
jgi:putative ABC transport system permease protein